MELNNEKYKLQKTEAVRNSDIEKNNWRRTLVVVLYRTTSLRLLVIPNVVVSAADLINKLLALHCIQSTKNDTCNIQISDSHGYNFDSFPD